MSSPAADPQPTPFTTSSPFLRAKGLAAGLTKHQLDGPGFHTLFRSVRLAKHVTVDTRARARAALTLVPGGVASHHTAAELWGGIVPHTALTHLTVAEAKDRRRRTNLRCHVRAVETTRVKGVLATTPEQTFCDLADELDLVDLVVLGDSLVQARALSIEALTRFVATRHSARAREAAALVREGVESPMESRVRLMIVFAGLPEPDINLEVTLGPQGVRYRLDLAWPDLRLAVEYDGRHHAESTTQWGHDVTRREHLDGAGWRVIVIRAADVFAAPWATVTRIMEAMSLRGYETDRREPPEQFERYFPGKPWQRMSDPVT